MVVRAGQKLHLLKRKQRKRNEEQEEACEQ